MEGDVAARMGGYLQHLKLDAEMRNSAPLAFLEPLRHLGDALVMGPEHRHFPAREQPAVPTDVVGVMVGVEDRHQLELFPLEVVEHRPRVARVDHRGALRVAYRPDVIVRERPERNDLVVHSIPQVQPRGGVNPPFTNHGFDYKLPSCPTTT